MMTKFGTPSDK